jgi:hypothetical protein
MIVEKRSLATIGVATRQDLQALLGQDVRKSSLPPSISLANRRERPNIIVMVDEAQRSGRWRLRHTEGRAYGDVRSSLISLDQSTRRIVPVFGRDFDFKKVTAWGEDLNAYDANMQRLTAVDHDQEIRRGKVTDLWGVEPGVQVFEPRIGDFP